MANSSISPLALLRAELIKLKHSPVWYILLLGILLTASGVFLGHLMDAHNMVKLNIDPWQRYFKVSLAIFNLFIVVPYLLLLVSSTVFIEQRADAWKYLYALPSGRGVFYTTKLVLILLLYLFSLAMLIVGLVLSGYFLNLFLPEYEFTYYQPDLLNLIKIMRHFFIASLGVIAWQYWLSLRFKNILVPLGIGVFGFVLGIIMSATGQKIALYLPYALPMIVKDMDMFRNEYIAPSFINGLNNVELHSIAFFLVFGLLGYWSENKREVV